MPNALNAAATIGTPVLPPATAEWSLSEDGKSTVATILGGQAAISRRTVKTDDSSGLIGTWELKSTEADEDGNIGNRYTLTTQLGDCASVVVAQKAFELRIRDHISKSNADLHSELNEVENDALTADAAADPF